MPDLLIRDVPETDIECYRWEAAANGKPLDAYLVTVLESRLGLNWSR